MKRKSKICESCGKDCYIWSRGRCKYCAIKEDRKPIKKYTAKSREKRKVDREGYGDFYMKHVSIIKEEGKRCQECSTRLTGHVSEVAHIVAKGSHSEIATLDDNILYLCGMNSENQCHSKFDGNNKGLWSMSVYSEAKRIFWDVLHPLIKSNYKLHDKFNN